MSDSDQQDLESEGLEVRCEYCGKVQPIKYFGDVQTGVQVFTLLDEFSRVRGGPKLYECRECAIDIESKLEEGTAKSAH